MPLRPDATLRDSVRSRARRRLFRVLLAAWWAAALLVDAVAVRTWLARGDRYEVEVTAPSEPETPWSQGGNQFAVDPECGHRPARNVTIRMKMGPLFGTRRRITRHQDNLGLVREEDVVRLAAGPRVLLLGDSHMMGVVDTAANGGTLLEKGLRQRLPGRDAAVYNAGCGNFSLHQYVLRARQLVPLLKPQLLLVIVFCGNDLLELDNETEPWLDDDLVERPANPSPPKETASARRDALELPDEAWFWQGLNQAAYVRDRPERRALLLAKAARSVELLAEVARAADAGLLFALLPSPDMVDPGRTRGLSAPVAALLGPDDSATPNRRLHDDLAARIAERKLPCVDLLPAFVGRPLEELYAADCHIFDGGHRLLADVLLPELAARVE